MKMTIDEALETIKGRRWIACSEKYKEAMNLIEATIDKYQKIERIANAPIGGTSAKYNAIVNIIKYGEVVKEDGKDD